MRAIKRPPAAIAAIQYAYLSSNHRAKFPNRRVAVADAKVKQKSTVYIRRLIALRQIPTLHHCKDAISRRLAPSIYC